MSHTRVDDREPDRSIDLAQLERTLRASIVLMKRSRQEILRSRRREKNTAALERVEVQIRDTRAPSRSSEAPCVNLMLVQSGVPGCRSEARAVTR